LEDNHNLQVVLAIMDIDKQEHVVEKVVVVEEVEEDEDYELTKVVGVVALELKMVA
jgi:hypothetical protein